MANQKRTYKVLDWNGYEREEVTCVSSDDAYWNGRHAAGRVWYEVDDDGSYAKSGGYVLTRYTGGSNFCRVDNSDVLWDYYAPAR